MTDAAKHAEYLFEKNFTEYMRGGSIEKFRKSYRTLYNEVIMRTLKEVANTPHPVFEIPMEFIEHSLEIAITIAKRPTLSIGDVSSGTDLKRVYFIGQGLCLDTADEFGLTDVITVNWSDKRYGLFSGGPRVPLSQLALDRLQTLMDLCNVNYEK
jgi:hypothetical protein